MAPGREPSVNKGQQKGPCNPRCLQQGDNWHGLGNPWDCAGAVGLAERNEASKTAQCLAQHRVAMPVTQIGNRRGDEREAAVCVHRVGEVVPCNSAIGIAAGLGHGPASRIVCVRGQLPWGTRRAQPARGQPRRAPPQFARRH